MDLPEIGKTRIAPSEVTVADMPSGMCIALYAVAGDKLDYSRTAC